MELNWIKVDDKLPEKNEGENNQVLVIVKMITEKNGILENVYEFICNGQLINGEWWIFSPHGGGKLSDLSPEEAYVPECNMVAFVTYWAPWPDLPKLT